MLMQLFASSLSLASQNGLRSNTSFPYIREYHVQVLIARILISHVDLHARNVAGQVMLASGQMKQWMYALLVIKGLGLPNDAVPCASVVQHDRDGWLQRLHKSPEVDTAFEGPPSGPVSSQLHGMM
jgi:hypothetical protein